MFEGHCECGAVRYRVDGPIHDFGHCHCSQCRRLHGAAFASFAGVYRKDFTYLTDAPPLTSYHSSDTHERVFCGRCGSNIYVALEDEPDSYWLSMGGVDGDPPRPESYHMFVGSKAPWYEIVDSAVQYDAFPPED